MLAIQAFGQSPSSEMPLGKPVSLVFDTDLGNDVDDALALGMIHALQSRGECNLLAVTLTKDHPQAAAFADVINTFYGRGNIPIGVCRSGKTPEAGKFNLLADAREDGHYRYPHDLTNGQDAPDAVQVLRKVLVQSEDNSVVIAQVGFSTNLVKLLNSPADAISPLDGRDLVSRKVRLVSAMAGAFAKIPGKNGQMVDHREYNVVEDLPAARELANNWPTAMLWSGFEIGLNLPYPHESILQDYGYVAHHPLAEAYQLYEPPPHNRPTWDLTSVLVAVRPGRGYFSLSPAGRVKVQSDGLTIFEPAADGKHQYLILDEAQRLRVTEALVQLSSQPPSAAK